MRITSHILSVTCGLSAVSAFTIRSSSLRVATTNNNHNSKSLLQAEPDDNTNNERLLISQEEVAQQMNKLRSKYPTAEADYLAAARARGAQKATSQAHKATDDDWQAMADEKKTIFGDVDDWEDSKKEAGNIDSQILIPMDFDSSGDGQDGEDDEPKLLLF
jgi:hypothetical protein